ncbi:uncharacterized protein LOC116432805 [Nomia melanderi]|uniref:uncharacterized protein LOC116432805 n=1 Tax=Nomia melanderi TaxID=2448451 RepID=UPI00130471CD|nr:uncharacterized protein LOC116432805 [Nomia melanderi]XP_031846171.1 uncharacterized protein LOC116432805 [Nomia melanderi]XP_031846258.1 uncharacterized protein LOC116432805 [Nomia melanderi]
MRWDAAVYLLSLLLFSLANLCWALVETRGCNRTVRNSVGWISWTGRMGRCVVRIRAPARDPQVIELKVRRLQVGFLKNTKCEGAYIQFSDGNEDLEDESGRYCGHVTGNITRLFLRKGPNLTIIMDSDAKFAAENPVMFSAQFSILPAQLAIERHRGFSPSPPSACPLECAVRKDRRSCKLVSPGYPGVYPRGIRCRIAMESSAGRFKIGGQPDDLFDLMNRTSQDGCQTENCEQHVEIVADVPETRVAGSDGQYPPKNKPGRRRRSPDHEEELEFIIGQTSRKFRRGRNNRRRLKKVKKEAVGSKAPINSRGKEVDKDARRNNDRLKEITEQSSADVFPGKTGSRLSAGYRDQGARSESIQKRLRHPQRVHKKSMGLISPKKNSHRDLQDISDVRILPDGTHEVARKRLIQEKVSLLQVPEYRYVRRGRMQEKLGSSSCVGDYLAILENVDGKIFEISKFCGEGHVPRIFSRGKHIIIEFFAEQDGTIMHDGFQLSLQETEESSAVQHDGNCEFIYKSSERTRENIKSLQSWYPPNTLCNYKFIGRSSEKISIHMKIIRNEPEQEYATQKQNFSLNYCTGNEIAVYNGIQANNSILMWSYCDVSHQDINNIQVPLTSTGKELLIQYYSAKGSYDGQEFIYTISYKFTKKSQNSTTRRQVQDENFKLISLRPVNFSALNLNESENCNCDFGDRIGSFKNWFMVLVVLGVVSFLGAIFTIIALLAKCIKMKSMEKKLLQTPKL